jgi:hypothetical protein
MLSEPRNNDKYQFYQTTVRFDSAFKSELTISCCSSYQFEVLARPLIASDFSSDNYIYNMNTGEISGRIRKNSNIIITGEGALQFGTLKQTDQMFADISDINTNNWNANFRYSRSDNSHKTDFYAARRTILVDPNVALIFGDLYDKSSQTFTFNEPMIASRHMLAYSEFTVHTPEMHWYHRLNLKHISIRK